MAQLFTRRKFIETACWSGVASSVIPTVSFARAPTDNRLIFVLLGRWMGCIVAIGLRSWKGLSL